MDGNPAAEASSKKPTAPIEGTKAEKKPKNNLHAPSLMQRCIFCDVKEKCKKTGIKRGSSSCAEARYMHKGL